MVGAVIVRDGPIVGEGYHPQAGEPHAEVFALRAAGELARGAAVYVTLEPCSHHGRTPPCVDALIEAGISEVCFAMLDPDPRVSGAGIRRLEDAGVHVRGPILEDDARSLNEAYIKHRATGTPFVTLKLAMSLDGKIATRTGDSKWITNEKSRAYVHRLRSRVDAIVVGGGTAIADNPRLTARVGRRVTAPRRVVVTSTGNIPTSLALFDGGGALVATTDNADASRLEELERAGARVLNLDDGHGMVSMPGLMKMLAGMGCLWVLIEGGGQTAASALDAGVVDKVVFFYAPKIIGGVDAPTGVEGEGADAVGESIALERVRTRRFGDDVMVEAYVTRP